MSIYSNITPILSTDRYIYLVTFSLNRLALFKAPINNKGTSSVRIVIIIQGDLGNEVTHSHLSLPVDVSHHL